MKSLLIMIGLICISLLVGNSFAVEEIELQKIIFIENDSKAEPIKDTITIYFKCDTLVMTAEYTDHDLVFIDDTYRTDILTLERKGVQATEIEGVVKSLTFDIEQDDYASIVGVALTLKLISHKTGERSGTALDGTAEINIDVVSPYVPIDSFSQIYAIGWKSKKGDLRIPNEVPDNFIISNTGGDLSDDVTCHTDSVTACYFLDTSILETTKFFVCKDIAPAEDKKLLLCSEPIEYTKGNTEGFKDQPVTVGADGNILISATPNDDSSYWEMVLSNGTPEEQKVCGDTFLNTPTPTCVPKPTGDLTVLLVGVKADDGTVIEYSKTSVEKLTVSAQALSPESDVIEVNIENKGSKKFHLSRDSSDKGSDPSYTEVDVDCHEIPDDSFCRGYFVNLAAHEYTVTVAKNKPNGELITSPVYLTNTVTIPGEARKKYQEIHVEITTTNISEQKTDTDVCFKYVEDTFVQGTQYELLAISKSGLWKKSLDAKKKDESHACFHTLDVVNDDFDEGSKFLVLLRDTENGKVLASGEASSNLHALRAIRPEVDKGSKGSSSTLTIVGAAIAGIACLMALVAAAVMFVMKINRGNDGLQYPLHRTNMQDSTIIHGLENPIPIM